MNTSLTNFGLGAWATGKAVISRHAWIPDSNRHSLTVTVAGESNWAAVSDSDWMKIRLGDRTCDFDIYLDANDADAAEDRTGTVTITFSDSTTETVTVKQLASAWKPNSITPSVMFFGKSGGSYPFELTSTEDWVLTPQCDWISIRKEIPDPDNASKTKTISVGGGLATRRPNPSPAPGEVERNAIDLICVATENTTGNERVFTLRVRNTFAEQMAFVHQMASNPDLGLAEAWASTASAAATDAEPIKIVISPNTLFTVSSNAEWLHAAMVHEEDGDAVSDYIEITADDNDTAAAREGVVTVALSSEVVVENAASYTKTLTVTQAKA